MEVIYISPYKYRKLTHKLQREETKMKRYWGILLTCFLFTCLLIGCGSKSEPQNENKPAAPKQEAVSTEEASTAEEASEDTPSFYGTWEVWDYQGAEVTALSSDEMEAFRGITVTYAADSVSSDGQTFDIDGYENDPEDYTEELLVENYNVNLGEWWNEKDRVFLVSTLTTEDFFGSQFFIADEDVIWIYYEGCFFLARQERRNDYE